MKSKISKLIIFSFLFILALSTIMPLLYLFITTFKTKDEFMLNMFSLPKSFNLSNYQYLLKEFDFLRLTFNSLIIASSSVLLSLFITSLAGFSVSKIPFTGKKVFVILILAGMFMPGQVLILPVYQILIKLNLVNSYIGLIIFYVSTSIPFTTFMIIANVRGIPNEILESAKIDGASTFLVYFKIILPLLKPTLATVAILNFIGYWNELLFALILLQDPKIKTVTVSIISIVNKFSSNPPMLYAGLLLSALPIILLFFVVQSQIIKGVSSGAVK